MASISLIAQNERRMISSSSFNGFSITLSGEFSGEIAGGILSVLAISLI